MRIAVFADVHGNLPALRAVLAELDAESVDAIVVAGDVVGGPQPLEALRTLASRNESVHWIRGNCEREAVAVYDGGEATDDEPGRAAAWTAQALDAHWRDALAHWPIATTLDGVVFCHGSPRRDDEVITRRTPDDVLADALQDVRAAVVVGGHTHQQHVRVLENDGPTYVNAGSVGMPYEGRPGAFWALVVDGQAELRETAYDVHAAALELRATGFPDADGMLGESLLAPVDPGWVTACLEYAAGRGDHPGNPSES